jgi:hypothetical protein
MDAYFLGKMVEKTPFKGKGAQFHSYLTFFCGSRKKTFEITFYKRKLMGEEIKEAKYRYGTGNFEKRKYPRFNIDLPIEYSRSDSSINVGKAANASEGAAFYLPEPMEMGQHLKVKLFSLRF